MPDLVTVAGFTIAPVAALVAVWMTSHLASKRTMSEKIWERKANAYGAILEALHEMDAWYTVNMNDEMLQREPSDEVADERYKHYKEARKRLRGVVGRESWLIDPAVTECMKSIEDALERRYDSWFENLDAGGTAVGKATQRIMELAAKELGTRLIR